MKHLSSAHKMIFVGASAVLIASVLPWVHQEGGLASPYSYGFDSYTPIIWPQGYARIPNALILFECVVAAIIALKSPPLNIRLAAIPGFAAALQVMVAIYRVLTYQPWIAFDVPLSLHIGIGLALTFIATLVVSTGALWRTRTSHDRL